MIYMDDRGPHGRELRDTQTGAYLTYVGPTSPKAIPGETSSMATSDTTNHTNQPRFNVDALQPQDITVILNQLHEQTQDHQVQLDITEARDTLDDLEGTRAYRIGPIQDALERVQAAQIAASRESVRTDLRGVSDALLGILNELVTRGDSR